MKTHKEAPLKFSQITKKSPFGTHAKNRHKILWRFFCAFSKNQNVCFGYRENSAGCDKGGGRPGGEALKFPLDFYVNLPYTLKWKWGKVVENGFQVDPRPKM